MAQIIEGDLTEITKGVILHQVNCQNSMGAGVALSLSKKYPIVKIAYRKSFENEDPLGLYGSLQLITIDPKELFVANSYSQFDCGNAYVDGNCYTNMDMLVSNIMVASQIASDFDVPLYIPEYVGCGLAGGNWSELLPRIQDIDNLIIVRYIKR